MRLAAVLWAGAASADPLLEQEQYLAASQYSRLQQVKRGEVSKSSLEVVVAQQDDLDISWSNSYASVRTVYCKGKSERFRQDSCLTLPNVGDESHTYLYHIVSNYDHLADWTVFTKAEQPLRDTLLKSGGIPSGITFHDYAFSDQWGDLGVRDGLAFVFTSRLHLATLKESLRVFPSVSKRSWTRQQAPQCPAEAAGDTFEPYSAFVWETDSLSERCHVSLSMLPVAFRRFWDDLVLAPASPVIFSSRGARFGASSERIRSRPKAYYEALLAAASSQEDACVSNFVAWCWYYVLLPMDEPTDVCPRSSEQLAAASDSLRKGLEALGRPHRRRVWWAVVLPLLLLAAALVAVVAIPLLVPLPEQLREVPTFPIAGGPAGMYRVLEYKKRA